MSLFQVNFQIDSDTNSKRELVEKQPVPFAGEQWHERRDLQPLLRDKPEAIDPNLMIISEEFGGWDESARRIDLLGVDRQGNLVVIEVKRVEEGGHMELQALRYAAMVSAMNFEQVVSTYEAFLRHQGKAAEEARNQLKTFLVSEAPVISRPPRVVLVAPSFSREITTTVLWLNEQGLDIRCIEANLYKLDGHYYLNIEQVIPLPSASDYIVKIREKQKEEQQAVKQTPRTVEEICRLADENGIGEPFRALLEAATRLGLKADPYRGIILYAPQGKEPKAASPLAASARLYQAGKVHLWFSFKAFEEQYPAITAAQAGAMLGGKDQRDVSADEMRHFIADLDRLFEQVRATEATGVSESMNVTE
jgi:hypothetical protein